MQYQDDADLLIKMAEIAASQSDGVEGLVIARKYYSKALVYDKTSDRAKWGLWYCCRRIKEAGGDDETNAELLEVVTKKLSESYTSKRLEVPYLLLRD